MIRPSLTKYTIRKRNEQLRNTSHRKPVAPPSDLSHAIALQMADDLAAYVRPGSLPDVQQQRIRALVSVAPMASLWELRGLRIGRLMRQIVRSFLADNLLGRAAELGFFFLFALFPTLVSASAMLGMAAHSASSIYAQLLEYLSIVIPRSAMGIVLNTFQQTTSSSGGGKITFGLVAAIWSASVGFSAIQDTLNTVYKVPETRSYWRARLSAIAVTTWLSVLVTLLLGAMLGGNVVAMAARAHVWPHGLALLMMGVSRLLGWSIAAVLLSVIFSTIYYFAPDVRTSHWHWSSPGGVIGIVLWLVASLALRLYLHFFNNYSVTYGSLGAVIILLTWFYLTGVMLLLGAEINSEIETANAELRLAIAAASTGPSKDRTNPTQPVIPTIKSETERQIATELQRVPDANPERVQDAASETLPQPNAPTVTKSVASQTDPAEPQK